MSIKYVHAILYFNKGFVMLVSRTTKIVSTPVHQQLGLTGFISDVSGAIPSDDTQAREAKATIFAEDWMYKLRDNPNLLENPIVGRISS